MIDPSKQNWSLLSAQLPVEDYYKELLYGTNPDIIAICAGTFVKRTPTGYVLPRFFLDNILNGMYERAVAAANLGKVYTNASFITLGHILPHTIKPEHLGIGYVADRAFATIMADTLVELGVDQARITPRTAPIPGLTEILDTLVIADERRVVNIVFETNGFAVQTINAVVDMLIDISAREWLYREVKIALNPEPNSKLSTQFAKLTTFTENFMKLHGKIVVVETENILHREEAYRGTIGDARATKEWQALAEEDKERAQLIRDKKYNFIPEIEEYLRNLKATTQL